MRRLLAAALLLLPSLLRAEFYAFTDLGTLGGLDSFASEINNRGEIVGDSSMVGNAITHGFLFRAGVMTDLGTGLYGGDNSSATGINNLGQIVGEADAFKGPTGAFLISNGVMSAIGDFEPMAINDLGVIVGRTYIGGKPHAARYFQGAIQDLGLLPGTERSEARGVNLSGQIAGFCLSAGNLLGSAFLYGNAMSDLGTLSGGYTLALAINDNGGVVGHSQIAQASANGVRQLHAFLYRGGAMIDLGTLGTPVESSSSAAGINNAGRVVGTSNGRAVVFTGTAVQDLNQLTANAGGFLLQEAVDINDAGQIIGNAVAPNGRTRAFLLTPDKVDPVLKVSGKARRATGKSTLKITGTASDDLVLERVEYGIGNAKFKSAAGTTKWKFTAKLKAGKNKIRVRAVDAGGRISQTAKLTVIRK